MIISKKRIISLKFLEEFDLKDFKIGLQITNDELKRLGIKEFEEGLAIEPSPLFGINCNRNANGDSYPDKTKPKELRVVNTIEWTWKDWAGKEYSDFFDITREVYQRIYTPASNIELLLIKNKNNEQFIIADFSMEKDKIFLKQTINMILEIFGFCEIFTKDLDLINTKNKIKRCNWELLPKGIRIRIASLAQKGSTGGKRKNFNQFRLDELNSYNPLDVFEGTGGFTGYHAYIFPNTCFLENAIYGNATYVVPKDNWEELSQMSKRDLLSTNKVIDKIDHKSEWTLKIKNLMNLLEKK